MNDTIRSKAPFEDVNVAILMVHRKHRKAAEAKGIGIFEFIENKELIEAMSQEEEQVCIHLGWLPKEFYAEEQRQIMAQLIEEN